MSQLRPVPCLVLPDKRECVRMVGRPKMKFPHFTSEEKEAMKSFILHGPLKGEWELEVRLPATLPEWVKNEPEEFVKMWMTVTAKRIDAVCEEKNGIHIIEAKKRLMASGIGQLLVYRSMYTQYFQPKKPIYLWLIAAHDDPDIRNICKEYGINVWTLDKEGRFRLNM